MVAAVADAVNPGSEATAAAVASGWLGSEEVGSKEEDAPPFAPAEFWAPGSAATLTGAASAPATALASRTAASVAALDRRRARRLQSPGSRWCSLRLRRISPIWGSCWSGWNRTSCRFPAGLPQLRSGPLDRPARSRSGGPVGALAAPGGPDPVGRHRAPASTGAGGDEQRGHAAALLRKPLIAISSSAAASWRAASRWWSARPVRLEPLQRLTVTGGLGERVAASGDVLFVALEVAERWRGARLDPLQIGLAADEVGGDCWDRSQAGHAARSSTRSGRA